MDESNQKSIDKRNLVPGQYVRFNMVLRYRNLHEERKEHEEQKQDI